MADAAVSFAGLLAPVRDSAGIHVTGSRLTVFSHIYLISLRSRHREQGPVTWSSQLKQLLKKMGQSSSEKLPPTFQTPDWSI